MWIVKIARRSFSTKGLWSEVVNAVSTGLAIRHPRPKITLELQTEEWVSG